MTDGAMSVISFNDVTAGDALYIVMELAQGGTSKHFLRKLEAGPARLKHLA